MEKQLQFVNLKNKIKMFKNLNLLLLLVFCINTYSQTDKPNIIFILADDHSYISAGFNGNDIIKTPNLDNLANNGIVFDNYYNTTAICMASRAQIMTGMLEYKTGCNFMHGSLDSEKFKKSYPILLKEAGYKVSFAGKFGFPVTPEISENINHDSYTKLPVDAFDEWRGGRGQSFYQTNKNEYIKEYAEDYPHSSRAYGAWASDYIRSHKESDTPFCMSISFKAPHNPQTPDPFFNDIYNGVIFPKPVNYGPESAQHLPEQARNGRQYMRLFKQYKFDEENFQESMRKYYQLIYGVDYAVGMIMDALKESGLDKNTIVIYTSDNGYFAGAHGLAGKVLPYEEAAKAPFIYFDPRHKNMGKQLRTKSLVGNIDVAPTILAAANVEIPQNMDGKNIEQLIDNPKNKIRDFLPVMNLWGTAPTQVLSIQTEDFKYIYWPYEGHNMTATEEVYNKVKDPIEMKNIANSISPKQLEKLRGYYDTEFNYLKNNGVEYNDYGYYKILFDRSKTWEEKKHLIPKSFYSTYARELEKSTLKTP